MRRAVSDNLSELGDEIIRLCGALHRAEHRLLQLIGRLDAERRWDDAMPSCAHWLNYYCGIDLVTAREKVRVARALADLPLVAERFTDGELSYSKVRAITRIATWENEQELVRFAMGTTATHVEQYVRAQRQADRLADARVAYESYRQRTFTCHTMEDGSLVFEGRLPAEQAAMLLRALERAADWAFRDAGSAQPGAQEAADAPARSAAVRHADALAVLAERFLAKPPLADDTLNTADRFQLTIHASAESLLEHAAIDPDDPPQLEHGAVLAPEAVRRIACDCAVVRILETGAGEPLDVGRKTRVIPPALQRALRRRDRGCRFPGCTHRRFVDGHHVVHWADGGETRLDNLVLLCRHHHRRLHEGGCYIVKDGATMLFFRADGTWIPPVDDARWAQRGRARARNTRSRDHAAHRLDARMQVAQAGRDNSWRIALRAQSGQPPPG
jgi:hypothetical protein